MNEAAEALYIGEFIGCALFCVLFLWRSRGWWRTRMGPNLFAMMFVLAVFQGLSLVARVIAQEWFLRNATVVRFWCFLLMFIVVWWRVILLLRIQHEDAIATKQDVEVEDVGENERVVVEGDNQRVIIESTGDTDPNLKAVDSDG